MSVSEFGVTAEGETIRQVEIAGGGLTARIIEWGAVLRELRLAGVAHPLTLGLERLGDYETRSPHFGAIAGRVANRIGGGRFALDGREHRTTPNDGEATLHGGARGFGERVWRLADRGVDHASLRIRSEDGEEGFPGAMTATVRYRLAEGVLLIDLEAEAEAPTLCNLAQHSYFNLDDAARIDGHHLTLAADLITPTDAALIPTGEVAPVPEPLDFRAGKLIGGRAADLNYILSDHRRSAPTFAARLAAGDLAMEVWTTEPGLQLYTADNLDLPAIGLDGRAYGPRAGVCLEPQLWPDAPNHPGFPSAVLLPGQPYRQHTELRVAQR